MTRNAPLNVQNPYINALQFVQFYSRDMMQMKLLLDQSQYVLSNTTLDINRW